MVDDSPGTEEIVIKPLDPLLANTTVYSGATILPNGTVALVLDVAGLATPAGIQAGARGKAVSGPSEGTESNIPVVYLRAGARVAAIDLADVERLEEFPGRNVQNAAGRSVIRYRNGLLPLQALGGMPISVAENMQAVVVKDASTDLGLRGIVVDEIVDIGYAPVIGSGNSRDVRAEILLNESVADLLATEELLKGSQ